MPESERHQSQKRKNYTLLAILLVLTGLLFALSYIKFAAYLKPGAGL